MDTKIDSDVGSIVNAVLQFDAEMRQGADLMGVRDEDVERMADAFRFGAERLAEVFGPWHAWRP